MEESHRKSETVTVDFYWITAAAHAIMQSDSNFIYCDYANPFEGNAYNMQNCTHKHVSSNY